ncbi:type I restriction-modification system subunit M [Erysipelothrix anatis]|uniref:type I restriction-modification system subunit M n=1 Tax=Erysipelothrix anatis TaxID=2683713 RepID=UPI001A9DFB15|nr:type I restriction-modification system subunit M [Erysipelothrix anatis]
MTSEGSGSLLLTVRKELPYKDEVGAVDFYGQELNTTTYNLARMNLMMHGVDYKNMNLRRGDTLDLDWPFQTKDGIERPRQFDAVVANPPYSQTWDQANAKDPRFYAGLAPKSKADYAFVQHGLYHLGSKGTMSIVLPHGVLFRGAAEGKIREQLIKDNMLDVVIGLPANLFYGTSIPTCILVFKGKDIRHTKDILFIDASREFDKVKNQNKLSDENIDKIVDNYKKRETVDKYSYLATLEEIEENDFNLNIPRYVDTFEEEEVFPLGEILKDMKEIQSEIKETNTSLLEMMQELTTEDKEIESQLKDFIDWMKES